ncbi:MAG: hypothetical protein J1F03_06835 [Oscillospiraceae bacterium]|nr:hypothetical protein [Oscillospiraceae bacterium]
MLEKNYTNPEGIGRFSFSESGEYRAPYKGEGIAVFVTLLIALILEGAVVTFALTLLHELLMDYNDTSPAMFISMTSAIVIGIGTVLIFLIAGVILARIFSGMKCRYSATEDKFVAMIGGDTHVIRYDEVQSIVFIPKYFLGKVKGYDVEITAANKIENFGVSFRGQYQSEKTTPFYIIKDRLEIIESRRADEIALYEQQKIGADKPVSQNEIDRARLRKQHESDVFPPNSGYREKMAAVDPEKQSVTMDSIAPRSTSRPKMAGVSAQSEAQRSASMQMPELKASAKSSAPWKTGSSDNSVNSSNPQGEAEKKPANTEMAEIAPKNKRPSSELFDENTKDNSAENVKSLSDNEDYDDVSDIADLADYADVESAINTEIAEDIEDVESAVTGDAVTFIKSSVKPDDKSAEELKKNQNSED